MKNLTEWFRRIPKKLRIGWAIWVIGLAAIVLASAHFRVKSTTEAVRDLVINLQGQSRQQYESLLREIRLRPPYAVYQLGPFQLPQPMPNLKVGGPTVIMDCTGAASMSSPEAARAAAAFAPVLDPDSLVMLVLQGKAQIDYLRLHTPFPDRPTDGKLPRYAVDLQIRNLTSTPLKVLIPRGQVFENSAPHSGVQNVVTVDETKLTLGANGISEPRLWSYCLNEGKLAPYQKAGNIAPLQIRFEFSDQRTLWRGLAKALGR